MNSFYNCYSYNQMKFIMSNNINPVDVTLHSETGKTYWIFNNTEELSKVLYIWTSRGKVARSKH